jgi:hypothetical protein
MIWLETTGKYLSEWLAGQQTSRDRFNSTRSASKGKSSHQKRIIFNWCFYAFIVNTLIDHFKTVQAMPMCSQPAGHWSIVDFGTYHTTECRSYISNERFDTWSPRNIESMVTTLSKGEIAHDISMATTTMLQQFYNPRDRWGSESFGS